KSEHRPAVHTRLVSEVFGRVRVVVWRELAEGTGRVEVAHRPESLRYVDVGLVATAEADPEEWNVPGVAVVHQEWMRRHGLAGVDLLVIEAGGSDDVEALEAVHVLGEDRPVTRAELIIVDERTRGIVRLGQGIRAAELVIRARGIISRVAHRERGAAAIVVHEPAVEPRVVEALGLNGGAGRHRRRPGGISTGPRDQILVPRPDLLLEEIVAVELIGV